jgi:hypothetical protein
VKKDAKKANFDIAGVVETYPNSDQRIAPAQADSFAAFTQNFFAVPCDKV